SMRYVPFFLTLGARSLWELKPLPDRLTLYSWAQEGSITTETAPDTLTMPETMIWAPDLNVWLFFGEVIATVPSSPRAATGTNSAAAIARDRLVRIKRLRVVANISGSPQSRGS